MKIDLQMLSIPPYISTPWKNVAALHSIQDSRGKVLVITLHGGLIIEIPHLTDAIIHDVFVIHSKFLEKNVTPPAQKPQAAGSNSDPFLTTNEKTFSFELPVKIHAQDVPNFGLMMHHNPEFADAPPIPEEILKKIKTITQSIGFDQQLQHLPKAEPHCHCPYCQLAKVFHEEETTASSSKEPDVLVSDEELKFREWDIKQAGEKLYDITNPLDTNEHYQVYLGKPLGCTCGQKNCEHIKAVLNS